MHTNGRGHILLAIMGWRRQDASAMQYIPGDWDWIWIVPVAIDRPEWIPRSAVAHQLQDGEVAYTWKRVAG